MSETIDLYQLGGADREFAEAAKETHDKLMSLGWLKKKHYYKVPVLHMLYNKNGFGLLVTFGCSEDVAKELII